MYSISSNGLHPQRLIGTELDSHRRKCSVTGMQRLPHDDRTDSSITKRYASLPGSFVSSPGKMKDPGNEVKNVLGMAFIVIAAAFPIGAL